MDKDQHEHGSAGISNRLSLSWVKTSSDPAIQVDRPDPLSCSLLLCLSDISCNPRGPISPARLGSDESAHIVLHIASAARSAAPKGDGHGQTEPQPGKTRPDPFEARAATAGRADGQRTDQPQNPPRQPGRLPLPD